MGFKNRIEEAYDNYSAGQYGATTPSTGSKIKEGLKDNWRTLAGGAALGAGASMLGDHFDIGGLGEFNNDMQSAASDGNYYNTGLDKLQNGIENMKVGESYTQPSGDSTSGNIPNPTFSDSETSTTTNTDQLKALGSSYAGANDNYAGRFSGLVGLGDGHAEHLQSWLLNNPDVAQSDISPEDIAKSNLKNSMELQNITKEYNQTLTNAMQDNNIDPTEAEKISGLKERLLNKSNEYMTNSMLADGGQISSVQSSMEKSLGDSMEFAKSNNLGFLLNGDLNDDLAFFRDVQQKTGSIPKELMPIYNAVMRSVKG